MVDINTSEASEQSTPAINPVDVLAVTAAATDTTELTSGRNELQPGNHWNSQNFDDADSAHGHDAESSTASISSTILKYRTVNGRTYHSDIATNQYCDFADEHPEAVVIGTDLSPIQPKWVPPNVRFEIEDLTQSWTFEENSIDYVHMRWLIGCVSDWTVLFKEAYRVLKPGGWIETYESDGILESDDGTVTEKSATGQWGHIFREGAKKMGSKASFSVVADHVQKASLVEAGFTSINEFPLKTPISEWSETPKLKEVGQFSRAVWESDTRGLMGYNANLLGWSSEELTVYCAQLRREMRGLKVHAYYKSNVVWAQKPHA
ncbi:methyltransferase type 11 [Grosmannia clavigera kw1407]|uniref:Methyltransferase type 11 n=1 Tax=Grosmannia clavigera (strain kw1407 / UAMH 11150) TaxID=655863 RepID=F0XMW8_GROCL|nr:methyltransferase type 11 [Grosmannia clavigera kw1407]EFX00812.1 methyltransferase type 11 [Grosmannia clavigera kw1407]